MNFRPSVDLPAASPALRSASRALAARLVAMSCPRHASALRGADKCWTITRAAKAAHASLPYDVDGVEALAADLLALASTATAAGHQIADAARAVA